MSLTILAFSILAFLIGSIPFGYIIGKIFYGVNLQEQGSGNIGMANAVRVLGKKAGVITFLLDFAKGFAVIYLTEMIAMSITFVSFAVVLGHCFTPWLKFKGGKGVATALGVFCAVAPLAVSAAAVVAYLVVWRSTKISALGSFSLLTVFMIFFYYAAFQSSDGQWEPLGGNVNFFISALLVSLLIIYRHKDNIVRLFNKEELRL